MKYFVVSDIHGQFDKLIFSLNHAEFDPNNGNHKLIICGDLFDRGTQNVEVYDYIKSLKNIEGNKVIVIKGNHELFFNYVIDGKISDPYYYDWLNRNGFINTLISFTNMSLNTLLSNIQNLTDIINFNHPEFLSWVTNLPFYYETKNYVFTHAGIDYRAKNWRNGNWDDQVWEKLEKYQDIDLKQYEFDKKLVMGHYYTSRLTGKDNNDIFFHSDNQKIFIDGGAAKGALGKVNILVIEDEEL